MQAVTMRAFGPPDVLVLDEVAEPAERPGWVRVRLEASALNWHDVLVRQGVYGSPLPHVPGSDGVGVRLDTGEQVIILPSLGWGPRDEAPAPGWQILGDLIPGTYAEIVSVPEECVVPRPAGLSLPQAAGLALAGVTTYRALFTRGRLCSGESMLVLGASGSVATMAVQFGVAVGARVVVTSATPAKVSAAQELGAVAGVDHTGEDWVADARALTPAGQGFDLVLDSVGRWSESVRALRPGGRCVALGASVADEAVLAVRPYYFGQFDLLGTAMGSPRDMAGLVAFMAGTRVAPPVIDQVFALGEAAEAHRRLESGSGFGKIVLTHS